MVKDVEQPSINDFGCGYGGLLDYLRRQGSGLKSYCGYDISSAMIVEALESPRQRPAGKLRQHRERC